MPRRPFLIVKTGSAHTQARQRFGDFDDWFRRCLGEDTFDYVTVSVCDGEALPDGGHLSRYAGAIVTGSPAMVTSRLAWSELTARWLRTVIEADRLPVLGVCYGHQLMAHALGGSVGTNPSGRRMGTRGISVVDVDDPLLGGIGSDTRVQVTHLEAVLEPPSEARVIARAEGDPHHALRFGTRSWGVQFHPEFDAAVMRCYVEARAELLDSEGFDSQSILDQVSEAPSGALVLDRFTELCRQGSKEDHVEEA